MWCGEALRPGTGVLEALRGSVMGTGARDVEGSLFDCLWGFIGQSGHVAWRSGRGVAHTSLGWWIVRSFQAWIPLWRR